MRGRCGVKPMLISFTSSQVAEETSAKVQKFLEAFLPRMRKLLGVIAIYHYSRPEKNDETTIVIWKDKDSLMAYR
jgi:mannose/fructose/N-acetylgalactosamine-specific phosphotransferase system component IID